MVLCNGRVLRLCAGVEQMRRGLRMHWRLAATAKPIELA
jgi:hypothetical protein